MSDLQTPQAGYDLARDDDVVALLMRQHGDIRNLFDEVEASTGEERRDAFRRLVRLLAVHETAEEEVVHPFARRALSGGEKVVDERLAEERAAKETLAALDDRTRSAMAAQWSSRQKWPPGSSSSAWRDQASSAWDAVGLLTQPVDSTTGSQLVLFQQSDLRRHPRPPGKRQPDRPPLPPNHRSHARPAETQRSCPERQQLLREWSELGCQQGQPKQRADSEHRWDGVPPLA
ncbi:hemerythrin domain-containing protein [Streptomyces sp. NPDC051636]|uniref:hemerythrin domain-containing protein n=1 Tax=Streptomyces sp. NPDC051636 TaxID=3365663 RepID=UPI0037BDB3B2